MSSLSHSGLRALGDPVVGASAASNERIWPLVSSSQDKAPAAGQERSPQRLHRLAEVRRREEITRRTISRRLGIGLREVQAQEQESADLPLSVLYRWRKVLDVPISELLEDEADDLSPPVMFRAKFLRVTRTAVTILERTRNAAIHRMAQFMVEQLVEIMPELKGMIPWPSIGKRRHHRDLGRAARLRLPADLMRDLDVS